MWPKNEFDESRPVNLILGKEKVVVQEETSFLATISPFFRAMFYSGFAEANMDSIDLPECDAVATRIILENMHKAKDKNVGIDEKIAKIVTPALFPALSFLQISSNIEKVLLHSMCVQDIEKYTALAEQTGNLSLLKAIELKSLSLFCEYRKTKDFKKKTIEQLVAYLKHPFLEYSKEIEIYIAVLIWIDFDFDKRKAHFENALCCVNWKKITEEQLQELYYDESLEKYSALSESFCSFYAELGYDLATKLLDESEKREEKEYFITVPFAYRLGPREKFNYGVCIYDSKSNVFLEQVFLLPNDAVVGDHIGYIHVHFFDFHVYSFMRPFETKPRWGFYIEKHCTLRSHDQKSQWKVLDSYGHGLSNRLKLCEAQSFTFTQLFGAESDVPFFFNGRRETPRPKVTREGTNLLLTTGNTDRFCLLKEKHCYYQKKGPEPKPGPKPNLQAPKFLPFRRVSNQTLCAARNGHQHNCIAFFGNNSGHQGALNDSHLLEKRSRPNSDIPSELVIDSNEITNKFGTWESFEEKVQAHVAPKVGQTMLDFEVPDKFLRRVNPLWFTKFP